MHIQVSAVSVFRMVCIGSRIFLRLGPVGFDECLTPLGHDSFSGTCTGSFATSRLVDAPNVESTHQSCVADSAANFEWAGAGSIWNCMGPGQVDAQVESLTQHHH